MKKSRLLIIILGGFLLLCLSYGFVDKDFNRQNRENINLELYSPKQPLDTNNKSQSYDKQYESYKLNGVDKLYLFDANNKKRMICVDANNTVTDSIIDDKSILRITSAVSGIDFEISKYNTNNPPEYKYRTDEKIFVISDVEGDFDKFIAILIKNDVITSNLSWSFGKGHLVLLGDFFDRGTDVTALLWLCYKLENEAESNGGKVHFILGNHELMNIQGDARYVDEKYLALANILQIPYEDLYGLNTELGRWLRSKNVIEIINDILFVHAGVSPRFASNKENIESINNNTRLALHKPGEDFYDDNGYSKDDKLSAYIDSESPLWYRGYFRDHKKGLYKQATQSDISAICKFYGVNRIVVGHTVVDEISSYYEGKVLNIDVLRKRKIGENKPSALLIEKNKYYAVDELGRKFSLKF